jgi:hypothetical protein
MPQPGASRERSKLADTVFAVFHVFALAAVFVYGIVALIGGNTLRFGIVMAGLAVYYALVLHVPVKEEIARKRASRRRP